MATTKKKTPGRSTVMAHPAEDVVDEVDGEIVVPADESADLAIVASDEDLALSGAMTADVPQEMIEVPVLHLFQDVGNESDRYGEHPKGTYVDSLTGEVIPDGTAVIPLDLVAYKAAWYTIESGKGQGYPVATWRRDEPQPTTDGDGRPIDWNDDDLIVIDHLDAYVLVGEGAIVPHVFRAKMTTLRSFSGLIHAERLRHAKRRLPGVYSLGKAQKSNDKGKWYVPQFTPAGDMTPDQAEDWRIAARAYAANREWIQVVDREAQPDGAKRSTATDVVEPAVSGDDIPF